MNNVQCSTTVEPVFDERGCATLCVFPNRKLCVAYEFNNQSSTCRLCQAGTFTEFSVMMKIAPNCTTTHIEQLFVGLPSVAFAVSLSCIGPIAERVLTDEFGATLTCNSPLERIPTMINIIGPPLQTFSPPIIINTKRKESNKALTGFIAFVMSLSLVPILLIYLDILFLFELLPFCISCLRKLKFQ